MNGPHRGQRLGYARFSSEDQNPVRQLDGLTLKCSPTRSAVETPTAVN